MGDTVPLRPVQRSSQVPTCQTFTYRLAKRSDAAVLARLHHECSDELEESFMAKLGQRWLRSYYELVLSEPKTVIVIALGASGQLVGFSSGSLDTGQQLKALRKGRAKLMLAALPAILKKPSLIGGLIQRYRASKDSSSEEFVVTSGPRADFLAWRESARRGGGAVAVLGAWYGVMRALRSGPIVFEVDANNKKAVRFHTLLGADVLRSFRTMEHKDRLVMRYPNNSPRF